MQLSGLPEYSELSGQISGYCASSGNLESQAEQPWNTVSGLCETIKPAVDAFKPILETLSGLWNNIFEMPINIIKAALNGAGIKAGKIDSKATDSAGKFGLNPSPVKQLVLGPIKRIISLIKALFGLVFKIIVALEELIVKIGKLIWEQLKQLWKLFKALGELVGAAWDTTKAKWRKIKRDREIARKKREAEIQAAKEAAEAEAREKEAKARAEREAMEAEAAERAAISMEEYGGDYDWAYQMELEQLEFERQQAAEDERLRLEAEEADRKAKEAEEKKKKAQEALEKVKKQETNRIANLWKTFKAGTWKALKGLKDGVLKIFQEIFNVEPMDTSSIDKVIDDMAKNAGKSVEKVMGFVTGCIGEIIKLVEALTGSLKERKANMDEEEFQYEMDEFEKMMQDEGYQDFYEMPPVVDPRNNDSLTLIVLAN